MLGSGRTLVLLLAALPSSLAAQGWNIPGPAVDRTHRDSVHLSEPLGGTQARQGVWFGGGMGFGSIRCAPNGPSVGGVTGALEVGYTLSRKFLLGIGTNAWTKAERGYRMTIGQVALLARYYPSDRAGGLFFSGAWGLGFIRLSDDGGASSQHGRAFRAGLGYDLRVASGVSVTPFASGSAVRTDQDGDIMRAEVWQMGVEVTVH